jgi:hypothetical protein
MNPLIIAPILEIGKSILDRLFPDPVLKAKAEMEMMVLLQTQDLQKVMGQLEINAKEAANPSIWVSGWRPAAGWSSVAGLTYATIVHPLLSWMSVVKGWPAPPEIDTETLLYVLGGMLGLGTLRTVERVKGKA